MAGAFSFLFCYLPVRLGDGVVSGVWFANVYGALVRPCSEAVVGVGFFSVVRVRFKGAIAFGGVRDGVQVVVRLNSELGCELSFELEYRVVCFVRVGVVGVDFVGPAIDGVDFVVGVEANLFWAVVLSTGSAVHGGAWGYRWGGYGGLDFV